MVVRTIRRNQVFLRPPQGEATCSAASALLSHLDNKRKDCWSEAVNNIDVMHFNRRAKNIINNMTGRTRHTRRFCPIAANSIASQLVKMEYTIQQTASHPDLSLKRYSNFKGLQYLRTNVSLEIFLQKNLPMRSSS